MYEYNCARCGGFVGEPMKAYGYAGRWCHCAEPKRPEGNLVSVVTTTFGTTPDNCMTTPCIDETLATFAIQKEIEEYWGVHIGPKSSQHMQNKVLWKVVNKVWRQAHQAGIEEAVEIVEKYTCKTANCQNGHYPLGMHEDGEVEWGGCPKCTDGNGRLPQYVQAEEIIKALQDKK